jgi:hypothetical protein
MISSNSRYVHTKLVVAPNLQGTNDVQVMTPSLAIAYSFRCTNYFWQQFDNLPDLAYNVYSDPSLWWVIADANPEILLWDVVPIGTIIRLPVK